MSAFIPDTVFQALKASFTNKQVATRTMAFEIYKSIWLRDRSKFSLLYDLHQNHYGDVLHFSMLVEVAPGWTHTLHFNGYMKNIFIVNNITAMCRSTDDKHVETVAVFHDINAVKQMQQMLASIPSNSDSE
jgi:hypothetical protein